jgi:hypothetical protein
MHVIVLQADVYIFYILKAYVMRKFITICLVLTASFAKSQVTVGIGSGIHNKSVLAVTIDVGYQLKTYQLVAGYVVPYTNRSADVNVFFVKGGKAFAINEKESITIGTGLALHNYSRKEVSKVDDRYSYNKQINAGKVLLHLNYEKRIVKDGAFTAQAFYSGGIWYGGVGMRYYFKKKGE